MKIVALLLIILLWYILYDFGLIWPKYVFRDWEFQRGIVDNNKLDFTWENYIRIKTDFNNEYYSLLESRFPEEQEYFDLEKRESEYRLKVETKEFYYIHRNYPEKINRSWVMSSFLSFPFTTEDSDKLSKKDNEYIEFKSQLKLLYTMRKERWLSSISLADIDSFKKTDDYKKIYDNYKQKIKFIEKTIVN